MSKLKSDQRRPILLTKSVGLGDTVKKVTQKLGIKQCGGCKKRQDSLNKLFPYKDKSIKEA